MLILRPILPFTGDGAYMSRQEIIKITQILQKFLSIIYRNVIDLDAQHKVWELDANTSTLLYRALQILDLLLNRDSFGWLLQEIHDSNWIVYLFHLDCDSRFDEPIRTEAHLLWMRPLNDIPRESICRELQENLMYLLRQTEPCFLR